MEKSKEGGGGGDGRIQIANALRLTLIHIRCSQAIIPHGTDPSNPFPSTFLPIQSLSARWRSLEATCFIFHLQWRPSRSSSSWPLSAPSQAVPRGAPMPAPSFSAAAKLSECSLTATPAAGCLDGMPRRIRQGSSRIHRGGPRSCPPVTS